MNQPPKPPARKISLTPEQVGKYLQQLSDVPDIKRMKKLVPHTVETSALEAAVARELPKIGTDARAQIVRALLNGHAPAPAAGFVAEPITVDPDSIEVIDTPSSSSLHDIMKVVLGAHFETFKAAERIFGQTVYRHLPQLLAGFLDKDLEKIHLQDVLEPCKALVQAIVEFRKCITTVGLSEESLSEYVQRSAKKELLHAMELCQILWNRVGGIQVTMAEIQSCIERANNVLNSAQPVMIHSDRLIKVPKVAREALSPMISKTKITPSSGRLRRKLGNQ